MTPTQSSEPSPRRRPTTRPALVVGTLLALVSAWLLLVTTPGARDKEHAFTTAAACPATGDAHKGDCLRTVNAVIDRTEKETGRKTSSYWLYVTEPDGSSTRTRIDGSPRQEPGARPGASVEVTYWRDQIRYVDFPTARRYTNADPRGDYRIPLTFGLGLGLYGAMFLAGAAAMAWGTRRSPKAYPWQVGLTFTGGLLLTALGAAAPWPTDSIGEALQLTALGGLVILAGCALAVPFLRRRGRRDDTIALKPYVLTGQECVPGVIMGEVPYAGTAGFLAAAPGSLATTPDPTGAFHRKETPRTLTPLRLRPPYSADPAGRPDFDGRAVVLECEDGGVPVLIVTRKKDMPKVLASLPPLPPPPATDPTR
ncbi:hypothetical protein [Streptomyces sp. WZ.A104]|uniref:hypothetical protein n=1 Tax=Streptomyces sp. WZ.A104 TaxID=2023771 RepID=UPI0011816E71|nr:hypothetical protein [Streptomyces sp. WZ.A104]